MPTIPTVFRSIDKGDYRTTSFKAHKRYIVSETGSGYNFYGAQHQKVTPALGAATAADDPVNKNGTNQFMVWNHIDHRYYRYPYDPARTHEHSNQRTVEKSLFLTASIFSIPYFEMGEKIKPGTLSIEESLYTLYDDGNGNLRTSEIASESFADHRKLAGHWTFNNEFRKFNTNYGTTNSTIKVLSHANTDLTSDMNSIITEPGVLLIDPNPELVNCNDGTIAGQSITLNSINSISIVGSSGVDYVTGISANLVIGKSYRVRALFGAVNAGACGFGHPYDSSWQGMAPVASGTDPVNFTRVSNADTAPTQMDFTFTANNTTPLQIYATGNTGCIITNISIKENVIPAVSNLNSGIAAAFDGANSYIKTPHHKDFNPGAGDNFAWSFWLRSPISQSNQSTSYNSLIRKDAVKDEQYYDLKDKLVKTREVNISNNSAFPYHVYIKNNQAGILDHGKVIVSQRGDDATISIMGTTQCTGSWHHICAQRSGSELQLWVDGVKENSTTSKTGGIKNDAKVMFGTKQTNADFARFSGSMAEMRYYKYGLSSTQISSLANADYDSCGIYQSSVVGNVFYRNGHVVVSSPLPKFEGSLSGTYKIQYNGVHTIYENEVFVEVPKDACNVSMNPSATYNPPDGNETSNDYLASNGSGELMHPGFISGTMKPYITSIGLYNDKSQLLAVGKLSQAVQKRDDIDMNFVVRWDY